MDSSTAYVDFNLLQKLLQMDAQQYTTPDGATHVQSARANQIRINIKPGADLAAVASRVQAAVDEVRRDNPDLQTQIDTVKVETWRMPGIVSQCGRSRENPDAFPVWDHQPGGGVPDLLHLLHDCVAEDCATSAS